MKKLLVAGSLASAIIMTGCATTPTMPKHPHTHAHGEGKPMPHKHHHHKGMKHKHEVVRETYTCDNDAKVIANYQPNEGIAILNVTAPTLGLTAQDVTVKSAPTGSGIRMINDTNPASLYEWSAKGSFGMLEVTTQDQKVHTIRCEGETPMHEHDDM